MIIIIIRIQCKPASGQNPGQWYPSKRRASEESIKTLVKLKSFPQSKGYPFPAMLMFCLMHLDRIIFPLENAGPFDWELRLQKHKYFPSMY